MDKQLSSQAESWQFNVRITVKNDPDFVSKEIIRYHKKRVHRGKKNCCAKNIGGVLALSRW
jgi:uncharacterized protein (UPF0218 family)